MSIVIYTYRDPYKLKENSTLWNEISLCPFFCVAQTMVNGLKTVYGKAFQAGRVTTVKNLTDALYEKWVGTACVVKQHAELDNIIVNISNIQGLSEEEIDNLKKAFIFNRNEVFSSIRTMFELKMEPQNIMDSYLSSEQRFVVAVFNKILEADKAENFRLEQNFTKEQIDEAISNAMITARQNASVQEKSEAEVTDRIVIHGVHQFSPLLLRAIDEISQYKKSHLIN